jgi:hypothetical protein
MQPGAIATVMWSVAHMGHYDADLCDAAAKAAAWKLPGALAHHISMLSWSFATLRHTCPEFFEAAANEVCGPTDAARAAAAMAAARRPPCHTSLRRRCLTQPPALRLLASHGTSGQRGRPCDAPPPPTPGPRCTHAPPSLPRPRSGAQLVKPGRAAALGPQNVTQLAWAFATRRVYHQVGRQRGEKGPRALAQAARGRARAGRGPARTRRARRRRRRRPRRRPNLRASTTPSPRAPSSLAAPSSRATSPRWRTPLPSRATGGRARPRLPGASARGAAGRGRGLRRRRQPSASLERPRLARLPLPTRHALPPPHAIDL